MKRGGWKRGHLSSDSPLEHVIIFITDKIGKELHCNSLVVYENHMYRVFVGNYKVDLQDKVAEGLKKESAYALDRFILDGLQQKGMRISKSKNDYFKKCYNV